MRTYHVVGADVGIEVGVAVGVEVGVEVGVAVGVAVEPSQKEDVQALNGADFRQAPFPRKL